MDADNGSTVLMERFIKCIENNAERLNLAGERLLRQINGEVYSARKLFEYNDNYDEYGNDMCRRFIYLLMVLLICTSITIARADFFSDIGSWADQTWNGAKNWAGQAFEDM